MYPKPDEPKVVERMRAAHHRARTALGVQAAPDGDGTEAWGWRGRTLSQPVTTPEGPAWLRLASSPAGQIARTFWDGSLEAETTITASVPRPRLRTIHDWTDQAWAYRAELYDRTTVQPVTRSPILTADPDVPSSWWTALHTALADISNIPTRRYTTEQPYIDWSMHQFLGTPLDTAPTSWTTAHGDCHWANLCAPRLQILDWEGWGLAPTGYDAAMLHSYSLLVPSAAARVHAEFADILTTPAGHFAELVTIAELLHSVTRGDNPALAQPLRERATQLLGQPIP